MSEALSLPKTGLVTLDGRPMPQAGDNTPYWLDDEQETRDYVSGALGDTEDIEVQYNWVLVVKHLRRVVARGILAAPVTETEDRWQGKVGMVLKKGPAAFQDEGPNKFYGFNPEVGDWVIFRNSDGWDVELGHRADRIAYLSCRFIQDAHIVGRTKYPGRVY